MQTVGERIVFLRDEREISQKDLAERIGITAATLSRYENNLYDPKGAVICSLARELHTSTDFLLGLTPDYNVSPNIPTVSAAEFHLLEMYRSLTPTNKIRISERILTLMELQTKDHSDN